MVSQLLFIGTTELLLIGGVALLFFGGKKLPEMMRGLGQGVKQFKEGMNEITNPDDKKPDGETEQPSPEESTEKKPAEKSAEKKPADNGGKQ